MKGKCILLISPEAWGVSFVSKHHYAMELAKENIVYFLNPATSPKGSKMDISVQEESENLFVINYRNLLPRINSIPPLLRHRLYKNQAKKIQDHLKINEFDVIWSFDPYRYNDQKMWKAKKRLYHCVDFHINAKQEQTMINSSDLTLVVSEVMMDYFKKIPAQFKVIGHGFNPTNDLTDIKVPGSNKLKAIYIGNVSGLLAIRRLIELAIDHPTVDFILTGPYSFKEKNPFTTFSNIYLIGKIKAQLIPSYLKYSSINLLLLKDRKGVPNSNSHKLMAYFDSGKVTLSDDLIDYKNANPNLIELAKNSDEFKARFKAIINHLDEYNNPEKEKIRRQFAKKNTYAEKLNEISNLLYFENNEAHI